MEAHLTLLGWACHGGASYTLYRDGDTMWCLLHGMVGRQGQNASHVEACLRLGIFSGVGMSWIPEREFWAMAFHILEGPSDGEQD